MIKAIAFSILMVTSFSAFSYDIGGAYAKLLSCKFGKWGYDYGYIGTYQMQGDIFQVYFGNNYCQY